MLLNWKCRQLQNETKTGLNESQKGQSQNENTSEPLFERSQTEQNHERIHGSQSKSSTKDIRDDIEHFMENQISQSPGPSDQSNKENVEQTPQKPLTKRIARRIAPGPKRPQLSSARALTAGFQQASDLLPSSAKQSAGSKRPNTNKTRNPDKKRTRRSKEK